jgi:hypothetical protein
VLGKRVDQLPDNYDRGELLSGTTNGLHRENSLVLQHGPLPDDAVVKMAQTFRSGTNDIDALVNFRPIVTKRNWRMDCGVAGYDNTS